MQWELQPKNIGKVWSVCCIGESQAPDGFCRVSRKHVAGAVPEADNVRVSGDDGGGRGLELG